MTGAELRKLRRGKLNATQLELAVMLGIHNRTIWEYENREEPVPRTIELAVQCLVSIKA